MEKWEAVENCKASKGLRFANMVIDIIVFYVIIFLFMFLLGTIDYIFDLNIDFDAMDNMNTLLDRLIGIFFLAIYYFLSELFLKGRSVAKFITGTRVVTEDGEEPNPKEYFMRSVYRMVPLDNISFLGENGWHDKWSETRVVVSKKFRMEIQNLDELNNFDNL